MVRGRGIATARGREDPALHACGRPSAEQATLLALPEHAYPDRTSDVTVNVGKTPYVALRPERLLGAAHTRAPHPDRACRRTPVRILDGTQELASHPRSFDRGQQIEQPVHIEALVEHKRAARAHRASDRLAKAAPASAMFLQRAAERGESLRTTTSALTGLLDRYGAQALEAAIGEALQRGVPHPNAVRLALERARQAAGEPPPVALVLPEHVARRDAPVRAHDLASYDRAESDDGDDDNDDND